MPSLPLVLPLAAVPSDRIDLVGGKAGNLARLLRAGLPVPAGLCVTTEAMKAHLAQRDLVPAIREMVADIRYRPDDVEHRRVALAQLRQAIIDTPLSVEFRTHFERGWPGLDSRLVAVRSSSTVEDRAAHSCAGIHDSFLLRTDIWGGIGAVKRCWASLWTERAFEYRERNRIDHLNAGMAVVVQRMIPAEVSGVMFTADPVTGSRELLVIEASFGLGEAIVQGRVVPDRFVLNRKGLVLQEQVLATKTVQSVLSEPWGLREWPVPDELQGSFALDESAARELGRLALGVERVFGQPQDIEWVKKGEEIFIVQSRPITTGREQQAWQARQVWSNVNIGEALPEAAPPMTLALAGFFVQTLFDYLAGIMGIRLDVPLNGVVASRPYLNVNVLVGMIRGIPLVNRMQVSELFGGLNEELLPKPADIPALKTSRLRALKNLPAVLIWFLRGIKDSGRSGVRILSQETDRLQQTDYRALDEETLAGQVLHGLKQMFVHARELGATLTGMQYYALLFRVGRRWFADPAGTIASKLLTALGEVESAQAGIEVWRLSRIAGARPGLEGLIRSGGDWAELRPRIAKVELGDEFLARWDDLMFRHGHHCRGEFDVAKPRWREEPDFVLGIVRSYLQAGPDLDPELELGRKVQEREQLVRDCRRRLRNPVKRILFNHLLKHAQAGAATRENERNDSNRRVAVARIVLLELGERLARRGVIAGQDDVFFLKEEELLPVIRGTQTFDVRNTIADRRAQFERDRQIVPPPTVVGRFDPDEHRPEPVNENAEVLTGLAVSPGIVTGRARVFTSYATDELVRPGEILVAPFTDPGWTPYFVPAAGIVVDTGGLLSHGSIVAREYGKPAVVNVGPATRIIRTGQMVQVDGNEGKVRILRDTAVTDQRPASAT